MTNMQIAELLRAIAASYELKDARRNKFKIIAYERAADAVEHASSELKDLWDEDKLRDVPGIGESIATHLDELFRLGTVKHFEEVMKGLPPAIFEMMEVPGIGVKSAYKLVMSLNIKNLAELEKAACAGKIATIEGFGEQSQADILKSLKEIKGRTKRLLLPYAMLRASEIIDWMLKCPAVHRSDPLGSLRRQTTTVGDIDIAVASDEPEKVINHFTSYPKKVRAIEKGGKTASILIPGDIQVDLMVQPPASYGSLLQHFTGSKHHNIALRDYALKKNYSLSEYGIRKRGKKGLTRFRDEAEFYGYLGLEFISPELREDSGEIEAARDGKLPILIRQEEVKADLQIHSSFDIETSHDLGESSMQEIIKKADELKYEYIAFTEHNPSRSKHTDEEIVNILRRKKEIIDGINYSLVKKPFSRIKYVFNSLEIDILPTGDLAVPEKALLYLDFALMSIHSGFTLSREDMTKRLIRAFQNKKILIFAHPTGRKLNERESVDINWPVIFEYCLNNHKILEINADPMRLDLPDFLVKEGIKSGVKFSLGTDAHHRDGMNNMIFGVSVARRGWATKRDIVNCLNLKEFSKMLSLCGL